MYRKLKIITVTAVLLPATLAAELNHIPQPWRQDAVVMGREEAADVERYLHELSFRHSQDAPSAIENGIRGTGGSIGSRRLYLDFRFRQDFAFNEDHQGFLLDIQRSEDFDGSFDRQLVGFRHQLTDTTELWLQGDVFADKSRSDIYFSGRHTFANKAWIHGSWILPDAYFNSKTTSDDTLEEKPQSFFLQWHQPSGNDRPGATTASVTYSPPSTFDSRSENLVVESESVKGALTHQFRFRDWRLQMELSGERTRRQYRLDEATGTIPARRDHVEAGAEAVYKAHRLQPGMGLHYFYLREQGYTGRHLDEVADIRRLEPTLSGHFSVALTKATTLRPEVYLGAATIDQSYSESDEDNHRGFIGKLALPFEILISPQDNATLTLAPTFYLHKAAFGGGNLQLHWPM